MTRKWIAILAVLVTAIGAALLNADNKSILNAVAARGVIFEKWGYKLKLTRLESNCDVSLARNAKKPSSFDVNIEASCKIPEDVDGVLITEEIKVLKALTASGSDIRLPPKSTSKSSKSAPKYRNGTFTPILRLAKNLRVAEVEIRKLALRTNPFRIDRLETQLAVVVAVSRIDKSMPAAVSQTLRELADGLKARVSSMRINSKRELSVELSCLRRVAGPKGPFIEAIKAIDAEGKTIGQARIRDGDPLGQKGKVTASFILSGKSEPTSLVVTIVTESKIRKIPFEITGIFQK
ncbi:MAG: hypothetical protein QGG42_16745 [Phycisphaerae bacterium]|jgi:hypothetical protein|nr:hypothetical protein [Phycisphaerae bacterium]